MWLPGPLEPWHNPPVIEQPAADFSVKPTLTGDRAVLRPFLLDQDADALREMLQDPEAIKRACCARPCAGTAPGWTRP
jgi:hypothetical protein